MRDMTGRVALVTGAGSGIGRETALSLAREGARLIVCDINETTLQEVEHELNAVSQCLLARVVDVSKARSMEDFCSRVHQIVPAVDILVNNAGVGLVGSILTTPLEDWEWILGINLWGVIHGCRLFAPKMVERGQGGHIVNVASLAGYCPSPDTIGYTTAKSAVFGLTTAMRGELKPYGIGVTAACPGIINTNLLSRTRVSGHADPDGLRTHVAEVYRKRNYGPDRVARGILRAIKRNTAIAPISPEAWFGYYLNRLAPAVNRAFWRAASKRIKND